MGWCEHDAAKQQTFNHISVHALMAQIWCGETNAALAHPSPHVADTEAEQHHMLLDCAQGWRNSLPGCNTRVRM